ncbi:MAG: SEC-C metal-binding domain-containing protein [Candidatus Omnitrophica bacterium]|nr:SEC-C metal-binding domain-containing protein [Syntrophales bacterium]MDD5501452.1 SEC-C metal-binding domain-containing protein [Candidatus Omnitrophota bacterium]
MVKVGRNDPCPCGSGKKYKKCCQPLAERIQKSMGSNNTLIPLDAFAEGNNVDSGIARAYYQTDSIDLLTWKTGELILLKNLTEIVKAIELCIANKFYVSVLKLTYVAIDNLAYLGTNRQTVKKPEFISWTNSFLLPNSKLSCTAEEMYAERCGLLHQNTAATQNLSSGMKNVYYTSGDSQPEKGIDHVDESRRDQCKFVNIESLKDALYQGILKFLQEISKDTNLKERLLERAQKYFANVEEQTTETES